MLELAETEGRILVTMDKDFGEFIYLRRVSHAGLIRLPDVLVSRRIEMTEELIIQHREALKESVEAGRLLS